MSKGGHREGAGRPIGAANVLTQELREKINAERCIHFLQDLVEGKIHKASIAERKDAAIALLKKVLPDCKHTEIIQTDTAPVRDIEREKTMNDVIKLLDPETREKLFDACRAVEEQEQTACPILPNF